MPGWWHKDRLPQPQPASASLERAAPADPSAGVQGVRQDIKTAKGPVQGAGQQYNTYYIVLGSRLGDLDLADPNVTELLPSLTRLLEKVPGARSLIFEVASRWGIQLAPGESDLRTLLDRLSFSNIGREQFPLPLQVAKLAIRRAGDPALGDELAAIINHWADKAAADPVHLAAARGIDELPEASKEKPCLMIRLEREKNGDTRYRLSAGMFRGRDILAKEEGTQYVSLEKNREYLKTIIPRMVDTVDRNELSVEFIVDRDLLNEEFDQWEVSENAPGSPPDRAPPQPPDAGGYPIGIEYPVVVRDLQRMMKPSLHGWWKSRWQILSAHGTGSTYWRWVDPDHDAEVMLRASLLLKDQMVCLALVSAPCSNSSAAKLLETALTVGAPAAIWLRNSPGEEQARTHLAAILNSQELYDLPTRVLALRREAVANGENDHHGRRLSLLWDDPNRVWEPTPLAEP